MDFLKLADKKIVVFGLANRKSVACAIAKVLQEAGADVIHVVRSPVRKETAEKLFPGSKVFVCDVEDDENIARVKKEIAESVDGKIHGIVHSIAFANYADGFKPFFSRQLIFPVFHSFPSANSSRNCLIQTLRS
jgi:enoyl-[acyl-carrier protein] reductase I